MSPRAIQLLPALLIALGCGGSAPDTEFSPLTAPDAAPAAPIDDDEAVSYWPHKVGVTWTYRVYTGCSSEYPDCTPETATVTRSVEEFGRLIDLDVDVYRVRLEDTDGGYVDSYREIRDGSVLEHRYEDFDREGNLEKAFDNQPAAVLLDASPDTINSDEPVVVGDLRMTYSLAGIETKAGVFPGSLVRAETYDDGTYEFTNTFFYAPGVGPVFEDLNGISSVELLSYEIP